VDDPITLEPISDLPFPPFVLSPNYFDPISLSSYLVGRFKFLNPLTREALTKEDCRALDDHVRKYYGVSKCLGVYEAFSLHEHAASAAAKRSAGDQADESSLNRQAALISNAAMVLQGLFNFQGSNRAASAVQDGFTLIDDDAAIGEAADRYAREQASNRFAIGGGIGEDEEDEAFPQLGAGGSSAVGASFGLTDIKRAVEEAADAERASELRRQEAASQLRATEGRALIERKGERERVKEMHIMRITGARKQEAMKSELQEAGRREIEVFREEMFERMRVIQEGVEQQASDRREEDRRLKKREVKEEEEKKRAAEEEAGVAELKAEEERVLDKAERDKAKKADKRRKDKDRQKAARSSASAEASRLSEAKTKQEAKDNASLKCGVCQTGIISRKDCFIKFGVEFCSSKCSREFIAPPTSGNVDL
jgi:hypothetical protein